MDFCDAHGARPGRSDRSAGVSLLPADSGPHLPEGASLIHITNDPDEAARAPVGDAIVADLACAARALCDASAPTQRPTPASRRVAPDVQPGSTPLAPENLWSAVAKAAPPNALWVSEAGSNETAIVDCIRPGQRLSHLSAAGGGLGYGLPAAVGAQLAAQDRPVVALMGDGSMHYAITALWTAAKYQIPITVVVASNTEYGVLKQFGFIEQTPGSGPRPAGPRRRGHRRQLRRRRPRSAHRRRGH